MIPVVRCSDELFVLTGASRRADAEVEQHGEDEHHRRVPKREEEPDAQRPLALVDELAGRVVDGRDVIGVEGVAHPERVGEDPRADAEELGLGDVVVVPEGEGEHAPAEHVQADDGRGHAAHPHPLARG